MQHIKVALIQQAFKGTKAATMQVSAKMIKEAAKNGAKLIVLQELHTTEYFCQSEDINFFDYALSFEEDCEYFSQLAKNNGVVLVASLFERRTSGLYHNSAVVFESNGEIAGKYRKMHIPDDPGFYEKFYFAPGDLGFNPILTSVGKL
ncbi:MAG: carbon-nitrogen hydrolase, partial [Helicobacter sp.]|nr:carbon-nitrogen hydrolase [Helicobacter sp.]